MRLDKNFPGDVRTQRRHFSPLRTNLRGLGDVVPALHHRRRSRRKAAAVYKLQKRGLLVHHPRNAHRPIQFTVRKAHRRRFPHMSSRTGDRIPMRINTWPPQQIIDSLQNLLRDDMLQFLGLGMHLRPVQAQHLHEERFHQPMSPQYVQRQLLPPTGQPNPIPRLVIHQTGIRERLDHARCSPRNDSHARGQLPHAHQPIWRMLLLQIDLLQVVLDRAGWHS